MSSGPPVFKNKNNLLMGGPRRVDPESRFGTSIFCPEAQHYQLGWLFCFDWEGGEVTLIECGGAFKLVRGTGDGPSPSVHQSWRVASTDR